MSLTDFINKAKKKFGNIEPYNIQLEFIKDLLICFEENGLGFFESPTGTGKSLSVLTSSITFIQ